jgi:hypothetical protein
MIDPHRGPLVKYENRAELEILSRLGYSTIYTYINIFRCRYDHGPPSAFLGLKPRDDQLLPDMWSAVGACLCIFYHEVYMPTTAQRLFSGYLDTKHCSRIPVVCRGQLTLTPRSPRKCLRCGEQPTASCQKNSILGRFGGVIATTN